jgi:hypothetical protein
VIDDTTVTLKWPVLIARLLPGIPAPSVGITPPADNTSALPGPTMPPASDAQPAAPPPIGTAPPASGTAARYDPRSILLIGVAVSTDTLAADLGPGLYGIPTVSAVAILAAATVSMSCIGFSLGGVNIATHLNRHADQLSSAALGLIGLAR